MYAQLLIALSFAVASYQDIKERAVSDLVWIPALVGAGYVVYSFYTLQTTQSLEFLIVKIVLIGGIALAFAFFGGIGQADAIAIAFVASDPYPLSPVPPLFAGAFVALSHIGYEYAVGNARGGRKIPMEQFLREQRWIPKAVIADGVRTEVNSDVNVAREEVEAKKLQDASVEVSYGVPTVAYLGIGYVAYLVYLVLFNLPAFLSLP
ncbi:MAG TPA: prepilin peptidase [Nitrososphaerales archaeon]